MGSFFLSLVFFFDLVSLVIIIFCCLSLSAASSLLSGEFSFEEYERQIQSAELSLSEYEKQEKV